MPSLARGPVLDDAVAQPPGGARLGAHERVPRPRFSARGRGLEQKRERAATKLRECGDWRVGVEHQLVPYGHEPAARGHLAKALEAHDAIPLERSARCVTSRARGATALEGTRIAGDIRHSCFVFSRPRPLRSWCTWGPLVSCRRRPPRRGTTRALALWSSAHRLGALRNSPIPDSSTIRQRRTDT